MSKFLIENLSDNLTIIQKIPFEGVDAVFDSLHFAFHPDGFDDVELDDRLAALWKLFLVSAGWTEDEFWAEWDFRSENHVCDKCKAEQSIKIMN